VWKNSNTGTTLTNQNSIQEEIRRLKSGNACCDSVQNILSSSFLSKNMKIKRYRIIIFPAVLYECETWSLTLREERRLRVFQNRMLKIFGSKMDEVKREWRKVHNEELHDLYSSPNIVGMIKWKKEDWGGGISTHWGEERCIQGFGGEI